MALSESKPITKQVKSFETNAILNIYKCLPEAAQCVAGRRRGLGISVSRMLIGQFKIQRKTIKTKRFIIDKTFY
jgi:hypothetical protein